MACTSYRKIYNQNLTERDEILLIHNFVFPDEGSAYSITSRDMTVDANIEDDIQSRNIAMIYKPILTKLMIPMRSQMLNVSTIWLMAS